MKQQIFLIYKKKTNFNESYKRKDNNNFDLFNKKSRFLQE
jgi:hypothetical protein